MHIYRLSNFFLVFVLSVVDALNAFYSRGSRPNRDSRVRAELVQ